MLSMDNAKAFSDTAMIVITRVGGEGTGVPFTLAIIGNSLADGGLAFTLAN